MSHALPEVFLARHGETAWAISGQHTGLTDIPLTERGERNAISLGERLKGLDFSEIRTSPLQRAMRTCELCRLRARGPRRTPTSSSGTTATTKAGDRRHPGRKPRLVHLPPRLPRRRVVKDVAARADRVIVRLNDRRPGPPLRPRPFLPRPRRPLARLPPATAATSSSAPPRSASSATSTTPTSPSSGSGTTTDM